MRTGFILHGLFLEDTAGLLPSSPFLPDDAYRDVFASISEPVRIGSDDVAKIMDDHDLTIIPRLSRSLGWFPLADVGLFFDSWVAVAMRLDSAARCLAIGDLGRGT